MVLVIVACLLAMAASAYIAGHFLALATKGGSGQ